MTNNNNLSNQPNNKNEWMVAYITHNMGEAQIVAGRLQHEGIPAILDHMAGLSAIGITMGRMGEIRILVHPQHYELSQHILFDEDDDNALPEGDEDVIYYDDWNADDDDDE